MRPEGSERAAFNAISHIRNESFLSLRTDFINKKEALLTYGLGSGWLTEKSQCELISSAHVEDFL